MMPQCTQGKQLHGQHYLMLYVTTPAPQIMQLPTTLQLAQHHTFWLLGGDEPPRGGGGV